jgi:murein DD-endopeptidase MepM/ murein hydrolase activator NlpD
MVIPHDAQSRTFSLKIPVLALKAALLLTLCSVLVVGSSIVYSSVLSRRLIHYHQTIAKNRQQQEVIYGFSQETKKVHQAISELVNRDNELRKLLGLKAWQSKIRLSQNFDEKTAEVEYGLQMADRRLEEKTESLTELKKWVAEVQTRYVNTPSRWPLFGRVVSGFGYRIYPWRGFHTGLDISGRYGAPIRVTANGVVTFAGWRRGYGRTIMVDHGYGKSTLYGHCSSLAVKMGQNVAKGQVIGYVGNTGYSTGPHLHYEVRNAGQPVNPVAYLNLNILTASRIWRR